MPRLTIEFPEEVNDVLTKLAKAGHTTKRDVLRRSLALYNHLYEQGVREGGDRKVSITDKKDNILKDILF